MPENAVDIVLVTRDTDINAEGEQQCEERVANKLSLGAGWPKPLSPNLSLTTRFQEKLGQIFLEDRPREDRSHTRPSFGDTHKIPSLGDEVVRGSWSD